MGDKFDRSYKYLKPMYSDRYYPKFLVDRVKAELEKLVAYLEMGEHDLDEIQARLDKMTQAINELSEVFYENDSEIETTARNAIAIDVLAILNNFSVPIKIEQALRKRNW